MPDSFKDDETLISDIEVDHYRFKADSLFEKQVDLAINLLRSTNNYDADLLNYIFNLSGLKGKDFANYLEISAPTLTAYRRKSSSMNPSTWKLFRIVFIQYLGRLLGRENEMGRRITDEIILPEAV